MSTRDYFFNIIQDTSGNISSDDPNYFSAEDKFVQYNPTSGSQGYTSPVINLSVSKIVQNLLNEFQNLAESDQKTLFLNIFLSLGMVLTKYYSQSFEISHLPPLHVVIADDGSILIEWIFTDFRIAFSIETNLSESSWFLVTNKKLEEIAKSGYISSDNLEGLIDEIVHFVIENT